MDHDPDREVTGAVRTLLAVATGDGPPENDLLDKVRRRVRRQRARRRVLVPVLATLTTAGVIGVAVLVGSVVTGTPSAQARVAAAAGRTAAEGYRVRTESVSMRSPSSSITQTTEGVFNPAQRTGRLLLEGQGREVRFVGDMVYTELPPGDPIGKRWVAARIILARAMPASVQLTRLAWQDPRQALAGLRSADAVRRQGRVSGDGWNGRRYSFELTDDQHRQPVTGTVDVDQAGRVRRLEVVSQSRTSGGRPAGTLRTVMEFRDYGAHEPVSAPPAGEVVHAPGARVRLAPDPPTARTERHSQP